MKRNVRLVSLGVGVIGAGGMGREHIANLSAIGDVEVVFVADVVESVARSAVAGLGAVARTDTLAAAASGDIDALVIASPDHTHAELTLAALDVDTPVLCEKPLASTVADAEAVVSAEAGRALIQVGFMRQFDPAHLQVRDALAGLGDVHHLRSAHRNTNHAWRRTLDVVFTQSLIHDVHTARWLSGAEFVSVVAQVVQSVDRVEHVAIMGELDNGSTTTIEFAEATYGYDIDIEVTASGGVVAIAQPSQPDVRIAGEARRHIGSDWFGRFRDAYRLEIQAWIDGVCAGEVRGATSHDGLAAQRVVAAALRSVASGERERI